ncbi:MAG: family 43 glycosylhydrolase [Bryobacteraceae bacterium]|nr:family 43 glycosylhydrolase [Bryobacteraceae bacterium]
MKSLVLALALAAISAAQHNPVLPGDYPDPSVMRVHREYWATATTSQWAPIFPLLRSTDLRTWTTEGAIFQLRPKWAETNFWAPELAEHNGKFFVYYTAKRREGPLCVAVATAPKPIGPWTDHGPMVCQEVGSIDAVPFTAEDGVRYLIWKEDGNSKRLPTPIWAQRLSGDGLKLTGKPVELIRNDQPWEGQLVEGPFFVKRGDWFYLFYSGAGCCGVKCDYAFGVARSRKLLGPYEKYKGNPLIQGNDQWKCPGHGSIVEAGDGKHYLLYHAYDAKDWVYVGRQGVLDEVTWNEDGWPSINAGRGVSSKAPKPPRASEEWQWPFDRRGNLALNKERIEITAGQGSDLAEAVIARRPVTADYVTTVRLDAQSVTGSETAGLAAYGNHRNFAGVFVSGGKIRLERRENGQTATLAEAPLPNGRHVELRMRAVEGRRFEFAYRRGSGSWQEIKPQLRGEHLPPWDLATRMALIAGGTPSASVRFEAFRVQ